MTTEEIREKLADIDEIIDDGLARLSLLTLIEQIIKEAEEEAYERTLDAWERDTYD